LHASEQMMRLIVAAACGLLSAMSRAQLGRVWFDEQTFKSPNGSITLRVIPSNTTGDGPATYVLRDRNKLVWKGEKQFTLWGADVSDDGRIFGYAYRNGAYSMGNHGDDMVDLWLIDTHGRERQIDAIRRYIAGATDVPNFPYPSSPLFRKDENQATI